MSGLETTTAIEVTFAAPVHLSQSHQTRLFDLIGDICKAYEAEHPERTMWTACIGQKMLSNPFMVDDDHPMQFDESVFVVECFERENYDFVSGDPS